MYEDSIMKSSLLYRKAFEARPQDSEAASRFAIALSQFRDKVRTLVSHVQEDMRGYTVHDISHLDALWEMASLIAPDVEINPAEGFVLGGAILLHDAGMTLAAYEKGWEDLMVLPAYADALAFYEGRDHLQNSEAERLARVDALRVMHAERASILATQRWRIPNSSESIGLIDNSELEAHYGETIGRVAASHHWPHSKLLEDFSEGLGAISGCPIEWKVDVLKVALLLRCADAAHIDHRRAPLMAYAIQNPAGLSGEHWNFQSRLAKPQVNEMAIVYTSTKAFEAKEADAWYLAFDAVRMIDGELRSADEINVRRGANRFSVNSVRGADSPESLSQYIRVNGWRPLAVNLRVTDVAKLASTVGGSDLYNYEYATLRELIQNSADAIEARIAVDKDFSVGDARILVSIDESDSQRSITVSDNGVGMSERTLTSALLDFGSSFWRSAEARQEMPGIGKALTKMRGRYGIGFFSVFMWANDVKVASRRFRDNIASTRILEFKEGLNSRPLIRLASENETSTRWHTQITLNLRPDLFKATTKRRLSSQFRFFEQRGRHKQGPGSEDFWVDMVKEIGGLLPFTLEVEYGQVRKRVSVSDWASISGEDLTSLFTPMFFPRDEVAKKFSSGMTDISENGQTIGRAFLMPLEDDSKYSAKGSLVVYDKGIFVGVSGMQPAYGFLDRETTNAARDRFDDFLLTQDKEWVRGASIKAFGICENEAETLAVQRALAIISAPDETKPLFIFQRTVCSYSELMEKVSKTKSIRIRLKQEGSDEFEFGATKHLDPIYALRLDEERLFSLIDIDGTLDRSEDFEKFWKHKQCLLAKLIRDVANAIGAGASVNFKLSEDEGYRKDHIEIKITGN
ncbi:ATP-binding protein [Pseudoxanthomonas winnipegensis]|uniref:HD domain-containing protein n=1 Tax=Pseudoxanthomonas winnipegensis TaxID=2480810 RepID=UPI002575DF07|nr:ATP-binding protein [Pseudoxanthomonas winnipegensis]WJI15856.1 ATP-binding protein [Pseudoxanthomonas winnipegensis]